MEPFLHDTEVKEIFAKKWTLDCIRMQLVRQSSSQVVYEGPGAIRFGERGRLEYVLYDTKAEISPKHWVDVFNMQAGEWLSADHVYMLRATDFKERTWVAEWLDADPESRWGTPGAVLHGRIRELRCTPQPRCSSKSVTLYAEVSGEIPKTGSTTVTTVAGGDRSERFARNVWTGSTSIGALHATLEDGVLRLLLRNEDSAIPEEAPVRLEEAISFALGKQIAWTVEQVGAPSPAIIIRDTKVPSGRPRLRPPIEFTQFEGLSDFGVLFDKFLTHLIRTSPGPEKRHPLAMRILRVMRASASMLEDEALSASVQVESIVREYFSEHGVPGAIDLSAVDAMQSHISQWKGDARFRQRVSNMVGNMKGLSAETALRKLVSAGIIEDRHRVAWKTLRHPSAHGSMRAVDVRRTVAECDVVHDLMLRLIFRVIGYTGQYSDHTTKGWPLKKLPNSSPHEQDFDPTSGSTPSGEVT